MHVLEEAPLTLRFPPPLTMTPDQFFDFCQANPEVKMEQCASGEVVIVPTGFDSGYTGGVIFCRLGAWAERDGQGKAVGPDVGFRLPSGATRAPDAAWTLSPRLAALSPLERKRFPPLCPDFIVEVRSDTDRLRDQQDKMEEYMANGARLGWLFDPPAKAVHIYRPGQPPVILVDPVEISADPELPGFVLHVPSVW